MRAKTHRILLFSLIFAAAFSGAAAQSRIPEKYMKKEKLSLNPMSFSIHVGWGFFPIGKEMRPLFDGTQNTTFGGPHFALQALFPLTFLWENLAVGTDFWYHRMAKRYLAWIPGVYYTSTKEGVYVDETVSGFGANGMADVVITPQLHLQIGGGLIYLSASKLDVSQEVTGLFPSVVEPTLYAAVGYSLARYEHGSVDVTIRAVREMGEYRNLLIQTDLGFAFRF